MDDQFQLIPQWLATTLIWSLLLICIILDRIGALA